MRREGSEVWSWWNSQGSVGNRGIEPVGQGTCSPRRTQAGGLEETWLASSGLGWVLAENRCVQKRDGVAGLMQFKARGNGRSERCAGQRTRTTAGLATTTFMG